MDTEAKQMIVKTLDLLQKTLGVLQDVNEQAQRRFPTHVIRDRCAKKIRECELDIIELRLEIKMEFISVS